MTSLYSRLVMTSTVHGSFYVEIARTVLQRSTAIDCTLPLFFLYTARKGVIFKSHASSRYRQIPDRAHAISVAKSGALVHISLYPNLR